MRVGLLGCGNVSPQYAVGLGLFPGVELVACADLDGPRAEALAAQHGIAALSPDELIGGDAVDILVNISPGMAHVEVSSAALAAGKHVYSEKPLAVDVAGGTLLLERSRAAGLRLGCAPDTFLGSQLQTARRLLDAGAIGTPVAAHATMIGGGHESWHPNPAIFYNPAGGPMLDMGPYYVTALLSFFGPASRVAASTSARLPSPSRRPRTTRASSTTRAARPRRSSSPSTSRTVAPASRSSGRKGRSRSRIRTSSTPRSCAAPASAPSSARRRCRSSTSPAPGGASASPTSRTRSAPTARTAPARSRPCTRSRR